jgi:hypothetical protein
MRKKHATAQSAPNKQQTNNALMLFSLGANNAT